MSSSDVTGSWYGAAGSSSSTRANLKTEERFLVIQRRRNRFETAKKTSYGLSNCFRVPLSTQTIRTLSKWPAYKKTKINIRIMLSRDHCQFRCDWDMDHVGFGLGKMEFRPLFLTDMSMYCLD